MDTLTPLPEVTPANLKSRRERKRERLAKCLAERAKLLGNAEHLAGSAGPLTREQTHRTVVLASLSGETCEDVKFFAFSRRTRAGTVDTPLPIVANTKLICNTSSHFNFGAPIPLGLFLLTNLTW